MGAKSSRKKIIEFISLMCIAAFLTAGCSSDNSQEDQTLDETPFGLPLPDTVTGNADGFEQGFETSASNWDLEAYIVEDNVNNTLDYYRNNLKGWGEPEYSNSQVKSFTFHYLEFTAENDAITIGATDLKGKTYLAIIGNSSQ